MIEGLLGPALACSPDQRFVFKYFVYGTRLKLGEGVTQSTFGDLVKPPVGTWYWLNPGEAPWIVCPRCGNAGRLSNHAVNSEGNITPSIICPMASCGDGVARCDAHYYGRLEFYLKAGTK